MITLYGSGGPNVAKARASLLMRGLPFRQVDVGLIDHSPELQRLTPIGRVPLICDDTQIVHDSLFIAEYLDRKYPELPRVLPDDLETRMAACTILALLERMFTVAAPLVAERLGFFGLMSPARAALSGYHPVGSEVAQELKHYVDRKIQDLAGLLGSGRYFSGSAPMHADFAVFSFLTLMRDIDVSAGPLSGWLHERKGEFPFDAMFASDAVAGSAI